MAKEIVILSPLFISRGSREKKLRKNTHLHIQEKIICTHFICNSYETFLLMKKNSISVVW